jgi:hypothetical protein
MQPMLAALAGALAWRWPLPTVELAGRLRRSAG